MRIFLTGATGYIGSAALDAFMRAGHHVETLVRNREKATDVQARGARAVIGDLANRASWIEAAAGVHAIVHAAIDHSPRGPEIDAAVVDAVLSLAARPGRVFLYTSGAWVLGSSPAPLDEDASLSPAELAAWRPTHEQRVLEGARDGIRPIVVRPGIVYGGSRGIVGDLFKDAANGLMRVIGTGDNHWPLVYDRDLGELYARLVSSPEASGIYHANDEGDERVNDIVTSIAAHVAIDPSIRHVPIDEARKKLGPYADALALDQILRSPRARALGWAPTIHSVAGNAARLFEEWRRGREAA